MANPEHLEILKQGVLEWNKWRREHSVIIPNLTGAHLFGADLTGAHLFGADLKSADLRRADLKNAYLFGADLRFARLDGADLSDADLSDADLSVAKLSGVHLCRASLSRAHLFGARLFDADLREANLFGADLDGADLNGADFTGVVLVYTKFADNDLSKVKGLEAAIFSGSSTIGIDTIYKSQGNIPEIFMRGCGVPESFIVQMRALVASTEPIQFHKSFISYSSKDQKFADRLYADLQSKGVRCWLATEDLKIGDRIRVGIDEAIKLHDKLLLILSKHSVASDWVEQEVETALERERKENRTVLFPIRLDDAVMNVESGWPALIRNTRNVGDFRQWKNHDSYQKAFDRLLRDLKAEEKQA